MARLASQAKLGYYPTPPGIVEHVKKAIALAEPGTYRCMDTCCGEGEALAQLTNGLGNQESIIETYGVELDEGRYQVATQKLDKVLWGDALNEITVSSKAFSLLWLNPPYDWDDSRRLEAQFPRSAFALPGASGLAGIHHPSPGIEKCRKDAGC